MAKNGFWHNFVNLLAHVSAWGAFVSLPLLMRFHPQQMPDVPKNIYELPLVVLIGFSVVMITVFYLNFFILVPKILNRKGVRYYLPTVAMVWAGVLLLGSVINQLYLSKFIHLSILPSIFPFSLMIALSLSVRLLTDRAQAERDMSERENENLKSELSFLRSQISPHFLFNVMNNTVALSRIKPELVEPTLIKLSGLMRYMLYNSDEKQVSLTREVEYLEAYIDLQKLRFGDSVLVNFVKTHDRVSLLGGGHIEPMLLIPFVENAFKHGTGLIENPQIDINLELDAAQNLVFYVKNKINKNQDDAKDADSGIGLRNVRRRLELLYGERQNLRIDTGGGHFEVVLTIKM